MSVVPDGHGGFTVGPGGCVVEPPFIPEIKLPITQEDIDRAMGLHRSSDPLIVSLYGGPGTGKSTTAAGVFAMLKGCGYNAEFVHEVAKDLTWEKRHVALSHQPYIGGKQLFKYDRLKGCVEVIVTDTSPLLGTIYGPDFPGREHFNRFLVEDWKARNTLDIFLTRDSSRPYNPHGRRQSQESAEAMDDKITSMLQEHGIEFVNVAMDLCPTDDILTLALERLRA